MLPSIGGLAFWLTLLFAITEISWAQDSQKYWIYFRDKPEQFDPSNAPVISDRALTRRRLRGWTDSTWLDRPVDISYLQQLQELGIEPLVQSRWLNAVSTYLSEQDAARVLVLNFVHHIEPVAVSAAQEEPLADGGVLEAISPVVVQLEFGPSWKQLANINAIDPLESGINGAGVRLGFLDTPYNEFQHPVFDHLRDSGRLIGIRDFVAQPQGSTHGMSVASVAVGFEVGSLIGPAYGAEVVAAVTEYVATETNQEEDFFVEGLEWLEAMGADVVNVSLGYTTFDEGQNSYDVSDLDGDTGVTTIAADRAASLGVTVVVSAGNSACSSPSNCWYYIGTPADGDSVISVGGIRPDSSRSSFSSFGPTADGRIKPDVAAPGSSVYIAVPDTFAFSSGTSFASPLVSGVVCQMLQVNPTLSPMEIREILRETASQAAAPDSSLGWGIINASAAVQRAQVVGLEEEHQPSTLTAQAFPNPATDHVFIHINAGQPGSVDLKLYDLLGRSVAEIVHVVSVGRNTIRLSTENLSPGLYVFAAALHGERVSGKLIVR